MGRNALRLLITVWALLAVRVPVCDADILGASYFDNSVYRYDEDTGTILPGGISAGSADLTAPAGITLGPNGNIYVGSQGTGQILFYDGATGDPLQLPGGDLGVFASMPGAGLSGLRFGPDGNLYVADFYGPNVWAFDGSTGASLGSAATVGINVGGLTFGPDGALYVGDFSAATVIRVDDGEQETFVSAGEGALQNPSSLLFLPDGDLLVVDLGGNAIRRYDEEGHYVDDLVVIPPEGGDSNSPADMQLDADGNLLIAVLGSTYPPDNRGALYRYDFDSEMLNTIAPNQWPLGAVTWIASPDAILGDYDGDGFVLESDYTKWRNDFGKMVAPGGGADGNGDGKVDAADYTVWRDAMESAGVGAGSATAPVPEPSACVLALLAALLVLASRAKRFTPAAKLLRSSSLREA